MSQLTHVPQTTGKTLSDVIAARRAERARENAMLLLDVSGSMGAPVDLATFNLNSNPMENRRIDQLRKVVSEIRRSRPDVSIAVFGLFDPFEPCKVLPEGAAIPDPQGGTPLDRAIALAGTNGGQNLIIISDGIPDDRTAALAAARQHKHKIDCIFIGPDNANDEGAEFLRTLAAAAGGSYGRDSLKEPKQLANKVTGLLNA